MDYFEIINELENQGKNNGFIYLDDIIKYYDLDTTEFKHLQNYFLEKGFLIIPNDEFNVNISEEELNDDELLNETNDVSDIIRMYLKEIGNHHLLSLEEELRICEEIKCGMNAYNEIHESNNTELMITEEEYDHLKTSIHKSEYARNILIESNLRLVVSIAKKYLNRGLTFLDLIQEGNMGLMKAVDRYDYLKGFRFSTYATWWIRQAISRAIADQGKTIRIPVHMVETINRYYRVMRVLTQELNKEPTDQEISDKLNISIEKIHKIQRIALEPISLESVVGDDEESLLIDFIPDDNLLGPEDYVLNEVMKKDLLEALDTLSIREKTILKMRFGIPDGKIKTLEEIGQEFGVTRERIRQIETKAIRKLRHPSRSHKLLTFMQK